MSAARNVISAGFCLVLAILGGGAVATYANFRTISESGRRVDHARRVVVGIEHALSVLKDAETGQRGYLLTGKDRYLGPYRSADAELDKILDQLEDLTADNQRQKGKIAELRRLATDKMVELRQTVALRDEKGEDAALGVVQSDLGLGIMDRARKVVADLEGEEERLLAQRSAATQDAIHRAITTFAVTTGMALALLMMVIDLNRRDHIQRERAGEAIRQSESWLSTTLTSIGDAVIATDGDGRVRFLNPIAETLTGWTQGEAAGRTLEEIFVIVNETTRQPVESPVDRVIREGVIVGLANHTIVIARDGTETAIEDSAAPIKDREGRVIGVVMVFQDATERRRHQEALRESEARFRQMVESIPQLAWMAHPNGNIFWYNRRWYDYTGTVPEQMEGGGWRSVHDPAVLPTVEIRWRAAIDSGEPFDMVFPLKGADGMFRPFLTRIMPLKDEQGRVVRWFGTNTDITESQELEAALLAAKDEAEHANKAKDRFLAVLSHELRTPLNPILLAASSMLERTPDPEEVRTTLEMIRQNVMLQSRLIDDLLDVMRIVRGKMPLHWEVIDGHSLIRQAIQICQSEIFGKELRLEMDLMANEYYLNADPMRFQQVIWNIVKNAVKFTPSGGLITIRSRNEDGGGIENLVIEVSDTGIGIEPDILPLIFDPFQQGETKITRKFGGLGLGLAICRGIVESHGGTLTAESPGEGRGTTFRITLKTIPSPAPTNGAPTGGEPTETPAALSSLKLLIVEDEPATLRLMARLLKGLGHEVMTANTIAAALAEVEAGGFDLIVSDIGLPDGSGLELMRRVVALWGPVPAIALTGYGMDEDIQRSREAGFRAHLTKPIDFMKLEAMIRRVTN
jgi:PAS domain S-box-containing protein